VFKLYNVGAPTLLKQLLLYVLLNNWCVIMCTFYHGVTAGLYTSI